MTNVPQIVRDRLKAAPPVEHPDANLLAAFAESSLSGHECTTVVDHLSRCADCREVVALALPATESVQPTLSQKRTSWLTWPALRWGLVAAGIIAIASFGVVRYQHESRVETASLKVGATQAKNEVPLPPAPSADADKSSIHVTYPTPNAPVKATRVRKQEPAVPAEAKPTLLTNPAIGSPVLSRQDQQSQFSLQNRSTVAGTPLFDRPPSQSKDLRVPASSEVVEATGANDRTEIAQNQPVPKQALDLSEPAVAKSKNAEAPQAGYTGAAAATAPSLNSPAGLNGAQLAGAQTPARWTISGSGALQRSFDQGQTWQDVSVIASAMPSNGFVNAESVAEMSARPASRQPLKKSAAAQVTFRAVAANLLDVWAGGSQGLLYHSTDNGNHWTRVVPTSAGAAVTGDIVSLDFPDRQHGKVTTSIPEVWTTSDAGQTWQKQ